MPASRLIYSTSSSSHPSAPPQVDLYTGCCTSFLDEVTRIMPCISYLKIKSWRLYIIDKIRPVKVVSEDYITQRLHLFVRRAPQKHGRWNVYDPEAGPDALYKLKFRGTPAAACMWRSWFSNEVLTNQEFKSRVDGCYRAAMAKYEVGWQRSICCCDFVQRVAARITPYIPAEWKTAIYTHATKILGVHASRQRVDEYLSSYTALPSIPKAKDMSWLQYFTERSRHTVPVQAYFIDKIGLKCGDDLPNGVFESVVQDCYEGTLADYPAVWEEVVRAQRAEWEEMQRREQVRREAEIRETQRREQARRDLEREQVLRGNRYAEYRGGRRR